MRNLMTVAIYTKDKPGPEFPKSFSRVIFRIKGEKLPRMFNGALHAEHITDLTGIKSTAQEWCKDFVDLRCRAFLKLNGYNPLTKEYINAEVISSEVDYFYCDHPTGITKS